MDAARQLVQRASKVAADRAVDVPSPCVSVCRMDPRTQLCEGCFRTLDEIAAWSRMEDNEKRGVWRSIASRALKDAVIPAQAGTQADDVIPAQAGIHAVESSGSPPSRG